MKWIRIAVGVMLCAIGVLWIGQGVGIVQGSGMSGHSQYAALGGVVALIGVVMLLSAWRARQR